ncbi:MAG: NAD(P)-dependent alcohol dehydrogenase [Myxococcales bacterium]|nr:NAD(P)-dependent alcohol dehydrogenase [Myxococcales bacterium]MCB9575400.1 NAD(P)-dependent alcohol dehydrogenase [Polyangiaceae bacterium]
MKALVIQGSFGLENLALVERPDPAPGPGQILLGMTAASLNFRDLLMVRGMYNPRQPLPLIPASDGVGRVEAVGAGVTRVRVGDRVCPIFAQGWLAGEPAREKLRTTLGGPLDGTLAQKMVVSEESVVSVPEHLSDAEAATLPCAAVTAWSALVTEGRLAAGETVLTLGTGGVSVFALQLAKLFGARVIITSSSDEKLARARELGADETLNYKTTAEWGKAAKDLTGGRGVDQVIEVGGAGTLQNSLRAVRPGGTVSVIGVLSGPTTDVNLLPVLMQNVRLQGVIVGHRESFEAMNRAISQAKLRPVVDKVFPLSDAKAAFEHMGRGDHFGKICIDLNAA